jgi:hypothetical protein
MRMIGHDEVRNPSLLARAKSNWGRRESNDHEAKRRPVAIKQGWSLTTMRVLLTNDDGPPDSKQSPYVYGLYKLLTTRLGMCTFRYPIMVSH